jgi:cytidine deaminase
MIDEKRLIEIANEARKNSYAPYSNYKVGAALLCKDGSIITGCNIENCSFTVGICAERTAFSKAISEGKKDFQAIAIVGNTVDLPTPPCGACRQFMSEFVEGDFEIIEASPDGKYVTRTMSELLPDQFSL